MLRATVQQLGDTSVLCCRGQIVKGDAYAILRAAAMSQADAKLLVLDLAEVDRIDAGALGVLLGLREWAQANAICFKLMNVVHRVAQILELTALDRVFEFCSVAESLCLLHRAAAADLWPLEQWNTVHLNRSRECITKGRQALEISKDESLVSLAS